MLSTVLNLLRYTLKGPIPTTLVCKGILTVYNMEYGLLAFIRLTVNLLVCIYLFTARGASDVFYLN